MLGIMAARSLAAHYDDWEITYQNPDGSQTFSSHTDETPRRVISEIMDIRRYPIPSKLREDAPKLTDQQQAALDAALERINSTLTGTGIDVQILHPGQIPDYTFVPSYSGEQGKGFPKDGSMHLAIMFIGMNTEKLIGEDAIAFLRELGMLQTLQPVIDAANETYDGIVPVICMDNGCPKQ